MRRTSGRGGAGSADGVVESPNVAAIITRSRRLPDDELPQVLSDTDLLAWGQSLGDVHLDVWTPDPGALPDEADETGELVAASVGAEPEPEPGDLDTDEPGPQPLVLDEVPTPREAERATEPAAPQPEPAEEVVVDLRVAAATEEVVAPLKPARISRRRRELVAMRRHLDTQAPVRERALEAPAGFATARDEPLRRYRPKALGGGEAPSRQSGDARTRLQERLAKATPVGRVRRGQWSAHDGAPSRSVASESASAVIRVRLTDGD